MRQHCARLERNGQRSLTVFDTTVRSLLRACFFASACMRTHCETTRRPRRVVRLPFALAFRKPFTALGVAEGRSCLDDAPLRACWNRCQWCRAMRLGLASLQADLPRLSAGNFAMRSMGVRVREPRHLCAAQSCRNSSTSVLACAHLGFETHSTWACAGRVLHRAGLRERGWAR